MAGSCSKDTVTPEQSADNDLAGLSISRSGNPGFSEDAFVFRFIERYYVTLPPESDPTQVEIVFDVHEQATVTVNGQLVRGAQGRFDLRETLNVEVAAENGAIKEFEILAHVGLKNFDRLIYDFKTKYKIPGVSFAISSTEDSRILYKQGVGFANQEDKTRVLPSHLFRLASMSKQMTALSIMKLIDQGVISLDDQVFGEGGILEDKYGPVGTLASTVTIQHLLQHTSGWTSNPDPMFTDSFRGQSLTERVQYVLNSPQNMPGTYSYFNMGYGILGQVIEEVTGKEFEVFMKEVLAEAGITDIHVGGDRSQRRPNEVVYYSQNNYNGYLNDMEVIAAAGGVIASTEQLLQLLPYIDGKDDIPDIISAETRNLMFNTRVQYGSANVFYALGWRGGHRLFPQSYFHGGNLAGTAVMWVVGPKYNVVMLANSRSYQTGFDDDIYYLLEKLLSQAAVTNWN